MHIKVHFSLTILNYTTKNKNNSITIVTISRAIHSVIAFSYLIDQSALIHCNISGPIFQSMIRPAGVYYTWFSTNHRSAACAERNSCLSRSASAESRYIICVFLVSSFIWTWIICILFCSAISVSGKEFYIT